MGGAADTVLPEAGEPIERSQWRSQLIVLRRRRDGPDRVQTLNTQHRDERLDLRALNAS